MLKRFLTDIPTPATPQNPLLRYELTRHSPLLSPGARVLRVSGWVIGLVLLVLSGYTIATDFMRQPAGLNLTESIWRTLFFPALFLQIMLRIMALSLGVSAISEERQKQRWASLRATENGASLALQTRIVAIFYRLRGLLLPILAVRVVLTGALLYELTSMRGDYLAILAGSSTPSVPLLIAVLLLAALMTAGLLMH